MSTAKLILSEWAKDVTDTTILLVAADAFGEEHLFVEEFTARWMAINGFVPGQRVDVRRKPYLWLFDTRLSYYQTVEKKLRKQFPHAILPRKLSHDYVACRVNFGTAVESFFFLRDTLSQLIDKLGISPQTMPCRKTS